MNNVAKRAISEKLKKAMEEEKLSALKLSKITGIRNEYLGDVKSGRMKICPDWAWETLRQWTNSGERLKSYDWKKHEKTEQPKEPSTSEILEIARDEAKKEDEELLDFNFNTKEGREKIDQVMKGAAETVQALNNHREIIDLREQIETMKIRIERGEQKTQEIRGTLIISATILKDLARKLENL